MARFFKHTRLLLLTSSLLLLFSCQEGKEAGDLLGQWRMNDSDNHYISFSGSLTLFRNIGISEVYGKFQRTGDSLFIQCYSIKSSRSDTILVEDSFGFKPFTNIRVKIEKLDADRLELTKGSQRWSLMKY